MRLEYTRATQLAATIGQGLALLLGIVGLFSNPFLVFIALFVWMGAAQENSMVKLKAVLSGIPVSKATLTNIQVLHPLDRIDDAAEKMLLTTQTDFPVIENEVLVGMIRRSDLLSALSRRENAAPISSILRREFQAVDTQELLEKTFTIFQECECSALPVTQNGRFNGLLTISNIRELLKVQLNLTRNHGQEAAIRM